MAVVVDTNIISYFLKRDTRYRLYSPHLLGTEKFISFMTLAELRLWSLERNRGEKSLKSWKIIWRTITELFLPTRFCDIQASTKSEAHKNDNPIETADAWIASVALYFDIPLVTNNRRHFENIRDLKNISEN